MLEKGADHQSWSLRKPRKKGGRESETGEETLEPQSADWLRSLPGDLGALVSTRWGERGVRGAVGEGRRIGESGDRRGETGEDLGARSGATHSLRY